MTNAWDKAKEAADRHAESSGIYIRLKNNGDKVIGAFCGDPYAREVVWTGQKYEEYDGSNPEHKGAKKSLRVSLNFYVPADNAMKVIEGSATLFRSIVKVKDKYGLDKSLFEIERQGEANSPKTTYSVCFEAALPEATRKQIANAQLHDLVALAKGGDESEDDDSSDTKTSAPISEQAAVAIVERLKTLTKSDVTAFLGKFGIARVRDLKEADMRAASELLDELTASGEPEEVDPFA